MIGNVALALFAGAVVASLVAGALLGVFFDDDGI